MDSQIKLICNDYLSRNTKMLHFCSQPCYSAFFYAIISKLGRGRFSKLPVITGPVKLFCFPFQMRVSKGLKIVQ